MKLVQATLVLFALAISASTYALDSNQDYYVNGINCYDRATNKEVLRSMCGGCDYGVADTGVCYEYVPPTGYVKAPMSSCQNEANSCKP